MPLYREDNFLVVHVGSEHTRFSFGLQDSLSPPEYKLPSRIYQNPATKEYQAVKKDEDSGLVEVWPIRGSKIADLDAFKYLLKTVLQSVVSSHPIVTINQIPLLLIAPTTTWSRLQVESITKYVIESLEFTGVNILDLSVASNFGLGNNPSSLVVNLGKKSTQIGAVINYQMLKYPSKWFGFGSDLINEELQLLLPNLTPAQIEALKTSLIFEVITDDESFYSLSDLTNPTEDDIDVAKMVTEENGGVNGTNGDAKKLEASANGEEGGEEGEETPEVANNKLEKNTFKDPETNQDITVGKERFQGSTKLINLLAEKIHLVACQIPDLERRQECYNNLIFVGSSFKIPGLKHAVLAKLAHDYLVRTPQDPANNQDPNDVNSAIAAYQQADDANENPEGEFVISQVPTSIRMAKYPDYFPEWKQPKESGGSWEDIYFLGGQIYAKQIFGANSNSNGELFVDGDNYEERGPQAIWNCVL